MYLNWPKACLNIAWGNAQVFVAPIRCLAESHFHMAHTIQPQHSGGQRTTAGGCHRFCLTYSYVYSSCWLIPKGVEVHLCSSIISLVELSGSGRTTEIANVCRHVNTSA